MLYMSKRGTPVKGFHTETTNEMLRVRCWRSHPTKQAETTMPKILRIWPFGESYYWNAGDRVTMNMNFNKHAKCMKCEKVNIEWRSTLHSYIRIHWWISDVYHQIVFFITHMYCYDRNSSHTTCEMTTTIYHYRETCCSRRW